MKDVLKKKDIICNLVKMLIFIIKLIPFQAYENVKKLISNLMHLNKNLNALIMTMQIKLGIAL